MTVDNICVASKVTKGDYGCTFAEMSGIPALLQPTVRLHSVTFLTGTRCLSIVMAKHGTAQHRSDKQLSEMLSASCVLVLYRSSGPPAKSCVISAAHVGCCRSVEEIGPSTVQKLAATSDATSIHRRQMPFQQVMTHRPVSQWTPCQHRLVHRPVSQVQGEGCWERCLGRSQVQGLNGSWITS